MAQSSVTKFYNTRNRAKEVSVLNLEQSRVLEKTAKIVVEKDKKTPKSKATATEKDASKLLKTGTTAKPSKIETIKLETRKKAAVRKGEKSVIVEDKKLSKSNITRTEKAISKLLKTESPKTEISKSARSKPAAIKKEKKPAAASTKSKDKESTFKTIFNGESKTKNTKNSQNKSCFSCINQHRISSPFIATEPANKTVLLSPKSVLNLSYTITSEKGHLEDGGTPEKVKTIGEPKKAVRSKIQLDSHSSNDASSPKMPLTFEKVNSLTSMPTLKLVPNVNISQLKEALEAIDEKMLKLRKLQSNPFMINCVASSTKSQQKKKVLPSVFASEKLAYLTHSDTLVLPMKYSNLSKMFCCVDTLVAEMHNWKEKITFDEVAEGVKMALKRDFTKTHLGQIVRVFPSAYNLSMEKTSSTSMENSSQEYQLTITPNLMLVKGSKKKAAFQSLTANDLLNRSNVFNENLLEIVRNHHQDFLEKMMHPSVPNVLHSKPISSVSNPTYKRWHPKFCVDLLPEIPVAQLPELPEVKHSAAKNVISKVKGSFRRKVGKTLSSVSEETRASEQELNKLNITKQPISSELAGICLIILEKIQNKNSAKHLDAAFQSSEEIAMLQKTPTLVHIVNDYFRAERKSAILLDVIVNKILHSSGSLQTSDEVIEDLKFVHSNFPSWLNFIKTSSGLYITLNKTISIMEMLDKAGLSP